MSASSATTNVYGGDEINAIVLDAGSYNTRIGYAGDDFPKITTPSYYAQVGNNKRIFGDDINVPRENCEIKPILKDSLIIDWDAAIDQYTHYFQQLKIEYREQPIIITEPIWSEFGYRKQLIETMFENFEFAGIFLAKSPTCVSFQQGRPNCLVIDIGHDSISVTPVIDGICLLKNSMRTNYSGKFLDDQIEDFVNAKEIIVEPTFKIKSKVPTVYPNPANYKLRDINLKLTDSYMNYQKMRIWHEFKETVLEVPERKLSQAQQKDQTSTGPSITEFYSQDSHKRLFEFPTGQSITLGIERFQFAESIFDPTIYKFNNKSKAYPPNNGEIEIKTSYGEYRPLKRIRKAESTQSTPAPDGTEQQQPVIKDQVRGLSQLITHTLSTIDIDLRASVAHNIIVTGGVSIIPQLTERLYNELSNNNPGLKIRLHAVGNTSERINQGWIGASVLASLGTFHQMWVTKEEYEEAGVERILNQRFR
ncbi:ARP4 [[Candida] subhashii]|uniref:Actin-related protein 4 n=1 Tax=[Candida] subhashii TaxID=561895 RepID=A0A8J5QK47_9ASCO|nr:ARP4 [[Candida] subhashii]KAG7661913.1 ARP4 [[Candida] subhashii]